MNKIALSIIALATIIVSCDKDKFETKPQIKVLSTNGPVIPYNGTLRVNLEFTDKEGDVNDTIYVIRQRLNANEPFNAATVGYKIPDFPAESSGEIVVSLDYQLKLTSGITPIRIPGSSPAKFEPDTMDIKFVLKDKQGNKSDTAKTNIIVIR